MVEKWKDIPDYVYYYKVSNYGNIKKVRGLKEKMMKPCKSNEYLNVGLSKNGVKKTFFIHQLVAMAFLGHKLQGHKLVIDHIDNNKLNNKVNNLQIVTSRHNVTKDSRGVSKYIGVCFVKKTNKWKSIISVNGKSVYLGSFSKQSDAAKVYKEALKIIDLESETNKIEKIKLMAKKNKSVGAPEKPQSEKVIPVTFYTKLKNVNELGGIENARFKAKQLFEGYLNNK